MKTREELLEMIYGDKIFFPDGSYRIVCSSDILTILKAPTQEQLNCPYCHDETLEKHRKRLNEDSSYIEEVKYCEVCGRKLGDD